MISPEDKALIKRCLNGDDTAWSFLVTRYSALIYNIAFRFMWNRERSEDLTQDIFLKIFTALRTYDETKDFKSWICRIAKNQCIDEYRKRKPESTDISIDSNETPDLQFDGTPHSVLESDERTAMVGNALSKLGGDMRTVIALRDIYGHSYDEISSMTGIAVGTVKSRINRGRIELAKILRKEGVAAP